MLILLSYLLEFSHLQNKIMVGFTSQDCWKHYIGCVSFLEQKLTNGRRLINASYCAYFVPQWEKELNKASSFW